MSNDRRKNRLLFDNNIEDIENMKTIFEFQVRISADVEQYKSPEFVLQGTDLRCRVKLKITIRTITFSLFVEDDSKNFYVDKLRFEEILWFNKERNYNVSVKVNKENPTTSVDYFYGTMDFNCKVTVTYRIKNNESINDENLTMRSNLQYMYEDEEFTDVIINVEGEEFSAHKALLVGNPVFAAMLRNDMRESKENIIYIKEMDPAVFQIILRYLYLDRFNIPEIKQKSMLYIRNHRKEIFDSLPFQELIKENQKLTGELLSYIMENGFP
ncbi:TD and POZ domain-containing protein 3-like [Polistes fuscatus]|uniref:TD and POZ domain-containing protein 3-like n=1 Tax=Polistes fuscatus TaxID=30207 RepID=UPI001CA99F76|nr:TD and POZ domain-containing protein 3-like [Polistes fuscatus]